MDQVIVDSGLVTSRNQGKLMNVRLSTLSLIICLAATHDLSAALVIHSFSGVVTYSSVTGVAVNDPFIAALTYYTDQPDLAPDDLALGRYGEFTLSLDVGPISVSQTNPFYYDFAIVNRSPGMLDQIVWYGGVGAGDIGLSAEDRTGTAFASDALPLSLSVSSFDVDSVRIHHSVTPDTFVDGRIVSISSRIVPEPSSLALGLLGFLAVARRRLG